MGLNHQNLPSRRITKNLLVPFPFLSGHAGLRIWVLRPGPTSSLMVWLWCLLCSRSIFSFHVPNTAWACMPGTPHSAAYPPSPGCSSSPPSSTVCLKFSIHSSRPSQQGHTLLNYHIHLPMSKHPASTNDHEVSAPALPFQDNLRPPVEQLHKILWWKTKFNTASNCPSIKLPLSWVKYFTICLTAQAKIKTVLWFHTHHPPHSACDQYIPLTLFPKGILNPSNPLLLLPLSKSKLLFSCLLKLFFHTSVNGVISLS